MLNTVKIKTQGVLQFLPYLGWGFSCLLLLYVVHTSWLMSFQGTLLGHGSLGWGGKAAAAGILLPLPTTLPHKCRVYRHALPYLTLLWLLGVWTQVIRHVCGKVFDNLLSCPLCPTSMFCALVAAGIIKGRGGGWRTFAQLGGREKFKPAKEISWLSIGCLLTWRVLLHVGLREGLANSRRIFFSKELGRAAEMVC